MKFKLLLVAFFVLVLNSVSSYGQLLQWNTFGNAGTETTEPSVANDANVAAASLTQGTISALANGNRFGGGDWWNTGNSTNNTLAEAIAGNDYIQFIVTPNVGFSFTPTSLVFYWDRSGTGPSNVTLRSSSDGYATDLGTVTGMTSGGASTTTARTITISGLTNITTATTFRLYGYGATATGGTGGFDSSSSFNNVVLNGTTVATGPCSDPSAQDTSILLTNRTVGGIDIAWTESASATGSLVVIRPTAATATAPTDNTDYIPDLAWATAGQIDTNNRVVYRGTGASVTNITGLAPETQYTVMIYAYNTGGGGTICYRQATPLTATFRTLATEPTAQAASVTCGVSTLNAITLNFPRANLIGGDGYLILYRVGGASTGAPVDGTNYTGGTPVGNYLVHGFTPNSGTTLTYNANGLSPGTTYHFLLVPYNMSSDADTTTLNYRISGTIAATSCTTLSLSTASDIIAVGSSEAGTISSTVNGVTIANVSNGVQVWQITVRDGGASADADSSPTILNAFTIAQAAGNEVGTWSDAIFSIGLFDGATFIANGTVTGTQITFSGLNVSVADNTSKTLSLRLSLKCPLGADALDGEDIVFSISNANTTFSATGSGKSAFTAAVSTNGTNVIDVQATKLVFSTQPTTTGLDLGMSTVEVRAYDACNNLDTGFTNAVSLTSSGTMNAVTPVAAVGGIATFSGIVHTVIGTNLTLTASSTVTGATSTNFDIIEVTIFNTGELLFVGYDGQVATGSDDEYLIATMVDIKPGTQFSIVNSRYEAGAVANDRTDKWGGGGDNASEAPYTALITYNGTSDIPAGSVLVITTDNSANWFGSVAVITGTTTTTRTADFSGSLVFGTTFNPNISVNDSDQMYLIQGNFVSDGSIDVDQANYILSGRLLHGLTNRAAWVPLTNACNGDSSGGNTRESRLPAALTCFNVESVLVNGESGFYENDKEHGLATIRQIITAVSNVASNWTLSNGGYTKDPTSSLTTRAAKTFLIGPSNPAGSWVGNVDTNWFNCANWEGLKVPDNDTDVVLSASSVNDAVVDATAVYSDDYNDIATCNNLSITDLKVQVEASTNNILEVHGNLSISASGVLDMDEGNSSNADGIIKLTGNWTNSVGTAAFLEGNGTVEFLGTTPQLISSADIVGTETFHHVILDNDFDTAVSNNLIATGNLTVRTGRAVSIDTNGFIKAYKTLDHSGTMTIESGGQLIQVDDIDTNTGTYTGTSFVIRRNYTAKDIDYVYWSAPTKLFNVANLPNGYRYVWNPLFNNFNLTQGNWVAPPTLQMQTGTGYIARTFNGSDTAITLPFSFNGQPNNGSITSVNVSRGTYFGDGITTGLPYDAEPSNPNNINTTRWDDNWNLVGNPYPSPLNAEAFLDENTNLEGFINLWTHDSEPTLINDPFYADFAYNYDTDDYITYNGTATINGPTGFNGNIASGQGFFVLMADGPAATQSIEFNNAMRSDLVNNLVYDNSQFYRTTNGVNQATDVVEKSRIWLDIVSAQGQVSRTVVGYVTEATNNKDRLYDAVTGAKGLKLYSFTEDYELQEFCIQGRALPFVNTDTVRLGFNVTASGSYSVAISTVDGLFVNDQNIYLEDKFLNIIHDLKLSPYTFTTERGRFDNRFVLRYTDGSALGNHDFDTLNNSVVVASNKGQMTIKSYLQTLEEVTVYDILGRQLFNQKGIGTNDLMTSNISMSQQSVIVKIKLESGIVVTKKVLL
ncbi:T9SS sorting signal type C domain-containing protein [Flavobacterium sp. UBA7682]|uniref:T9SS sorting signal type C domain-containing protein n=1 Tax=Flavobacterium sp. UBA7682 TaxID=1946560 RepID=UPI0025C4CF71|nr:T9SS sorting signal type C domain-containing protein [Flavobacterium sp. UBA7682]